MPKSSEKGTTAVLDTTARSSHAIPPPPPFTKNTSTRLSRPPFCPTWRAGVLLNHILCLLVWSESKMSNLPQHNSLPHRSISVTRSHKRRRLNTWTSRQRGVTDLRYAARGGTGYLSTAETTRRSGRVPRYVSGPFAIVYCQ